MSGLDVLAGACRSCGRDLVQVPGVRTYHPARVMDPEDSCPALLPYPGTDTLSFDVPADQFIPGARAAQLAPARVPSEEG